MFLSRSSALNAHNPTGNVMQGLLVHGNLMDSAARTAHVSSPSWSRLQYVHELAVEQSPWAMAPAAASLCRLRGCACAVGCVIPVPRRRRRQWHAAARAPGRSRGGLLVAAFDLRP